MAYDKLTYIAYRHAEMRAIDAIRLARTETRKCGFPTFTAPRELTRQPKPNHDMIWVSNTDDNGMRFVDYADKVARHSRRLNHTGWYTTDNSDDVTARGAIYRLPHSRGFVAGMADPYNDGSAYIDSSAIYATKTDAAYPADSIAEHYAERERDYQAASQAGQRYRDLGDDIADARRNCLALIREAKAACADLPATVREAIRDSIVSYRRDISKARTERAELLDIYGRASAFNDE